MILVYILIAYAILTNVTVMFLGHNGIDPDDLDGTFLGSCFVYVLALGCGLTVGLCYTARAIAHWYGFMDEVTEFMEEM